MALALDLRKQIVFLLGATGAGKTTIIESALQEYPVSVGAVQVGKMMRAKYPPEHFKGEGAPDHTQAEVRQMMREGVVHQFSSGKRTVIVDGQPRRVDHIDECVHIAMEAGARAKFVLLYAEKGARYIRICNDREGASLELAMSRLEGDMVTGYEVLAGLLERGLTAQVVRTDQGPAHELVDDVLMRL